MRSAGEWLDELARMTIGCHRLDDDQYDVTNHAEAGTVIITPSEPCALRLDNDYPEKLIA